MRSILFILLPLVVFVAITSARPSSTPFPHLSFFDHDIKTTFPVRMLYTEDEVTQSPLIPEPLLRSILNQEYGIIGGNVHVLTGYEDSNFKLTEVKWEDEISNGTNEVIVKVTNPIEAKELEVIDIQYEIYSLLRSKGVPTPEGIRTKSGLLWTEQLVKDQLKLPVRVFKLLPGSNLENFDFTPELTEQIGRMLAVVHDTLDGYSRKLSHIPFISPENVLCVQREMTILESRNLLDEEKKTLVQQTFALLHSEILNNRSEFDEGLIHSDFNETNLLVKDGKISGVLDFGDMHCSLRVFDVAAAILYLHLSDRLQQGIDSIATHLLLGYRSVRSFTASNRSLFIAMRARLACSLIYGLRTARINYRGGSIDYVLRTQSNGWETLEMLSKRNN